MGAHPDWFVVGAWDDARYAQPVHLTEAGRLALTQRARYDLEPVRGGLVEPGWEAIPRAVVETRGGPHQGDPMKGACCAAYHSRPSSRSCSRT